MSERHSTPIGVRGSRIGGPPTLEAARTETVYEPRRRHTYVCMFGHQTSLVFHAAATPPPTWDCGTCPATGRHESLDPDAPIDAPTGRVIKTHLDQLHGRRTEEELEALLAEALHNYRTTGKAF